MKEIVGVSVNNQPEYAKVSKGAKRREKELGKEQKESREFKKSIATL